MLCLLLGSFPAWAQTTNLTPLYSFDGGANGGSPTGLILGSDNNFYGVTLTGGAAGRGTIYRTNSGGGQLTTLYSFQVADVGNPTGLIRTSNGDLYGVTQGNPSGVGGTFFKFVPSTGVFTTVFSFSFQGPNGAVPNPDLALDSAGNIYGTTQYGGTISLSCDSQSCGTIFKYVPNPGTFSTFYSFSGGANGANPKAGLTLASDGNFYGTTTVGGSNSAGTTFRITTGGTLTTTLSLVGGTSGFNPSAPLLQGTDGFLYGTTLGALLGFGDSGVVFQTPTSGSNYAVVYPFSGAGQDGGGPNTRLVQSTDADPRVTGQLYGTTTGAFSQCLFGTVYKIPTFGQEVTLHCFTGANDGSAPTSNLIQGADKNFYGTASSGGANGNGVLYKLIDPKVPNPIISAISPTTAGPGSQLTISGTGFSLVNKITFTRLSGDVAVSAAFRVLSDTQIQVTVPLGAVSGFIRLEASNPSTYAAATSANPVTITPGITNISPVQGPVGTTVNILGSGLTGTTSVRFNGTSSLTFFVNNSLLFPGGISAIVPFGATTGPISVTTASGTATSPTNFTVGAAFPLRITSVDTIEGPVGTTLTVGGTGFTGVNSVLFYNNVPATFTINSDGQLTTTVPLGAITGPLTLSTPTSTTTSNGYFQVTSLVPTITSFSPTSGPIGTTVTLTGTGFTGTNAVRIGNIAGTFTVNSNTSLTFTIPTGAVTAPISVTTPGGTVTSLINFTVGSILPTFDKPRANFGAAIVLTNGNFAGATSVTFNGLPATFTVNSATQITATVPPGATSGNIVVTAPGGTVTLSGFIVNPVAIRTLGWQQSGTGDFNGDGRPDLLWRNYTTGVNRVWFMSGTAFLSQVDLISQTDPNWQLVGAADFTADGKPDLVWRNFITGQNAVWQMNGSTFVQSLPLQSVTDPNFQLAGIGDLTGDGKPDLIWRNAGTGFVGAGDVYVWQMNGTTFVTANLIGPVTDPLWQMAGVGDFTNDGSPDLIWRYWGATGDFATQVYLWQMNGFTYQNAFLIGPVGDLNFQLTGVGEFTGDSQRDLFWSNNATGQNFVWRMSGYTYQEALFIGPTPTN